MSQDPDLSDDGSAGRVEEVLRFLHIIGLDREEQSSGCLGIGKENAEFFRDVISKVGELLSEGEIFS